MICATSGLAAQSHYGTAGVCVPTAFPDTVRGDTPAATTEARCAWLAAHDYGRLKVNGKDDPLRLDPDGDGGACGTGDAPGAPHH